jgi:hypothetical protein
MKKLFPFVAVGLAVFILSFNPRPIPHSLLHRKKVTNAVDPLNPTLYPLFITNFKNNSQLEKLLSLEKRGCLTNRFKKIIFQYFYQDDQRGFTLAAYVGARKKKDFETSVVQFSSYTACSSPDKIGPNVYLGDIEFADQKNAIKILKTLSPDSPKYQYIVFKPSLETKIEGGVTRVSVNYKIYTVQNLTEICNIKDSSETSSFSITTVNVSANPSPPHGGN